jgi:uncharacterized protein (TIGR00297 family)
MNWLQLILGLFLAMGIAAAGNLAGALSKSGAWAAVVVGAITFGVGGFLPAVLLITFFVSSSVLSRVGGIRKREVAQAFAKGGKRDYGQVIANGGLAAILAALYGLTNQKIWLAGLAGALAAVNADTWSTELGVLARHWPRMITNGQRVEPGTSGAITLEGTAAALGGAMTIGIITGIGGGGFRFGSLVVIGGFMGAVVDSVLGASVQAIYYCPVCDKQTEHHPYHSCNTATRYDRGWRWLSNDGVNFVASLVGAMLPLMIWWLL